jgi:hypothetical protein
LPSHLIIDPRKIEKVYQQMVQRPRTAPQPIGDVLTPEQIRENTRIANAVNARQRLREATAAGTMEGRASELVNAAAKRSRHQRRCLIPFRLGPLEFVQCPILEPPQIRPSGNDFP